MAASLRYLQPHLTPRALLIGASVIEPAAFAPAPMTTIAINLARSYYIEAKLFGDDISAKDNPFSIADHNHRVWFASLLTEAGDHLEVAASDDGDLTIYG